MAGVMTRHDAAVLLGRLGGLKGGPARAAALAPMERSEIAQRGGNARWGKADLDVDDVCGDIVEHLSESKGVSMTELLAVTSRKRRVLAYHLRAHLLPDVVRVVDGSYWLVW